MIIREDLVQNTEEWLEFHIGKISGSKAMAYSRPRLVLKSELGEYARSKGYKFPKTLTIPKIRKLLTQEERDELDFSVQLNDSIYKLIAEQVAKPVNPNDYTSDKVSKSELAMLRGHILEEEAREKISKKIGKEILKGRVWQSSKNPNIICSPDGEIISKNGKVEEAVEIKCLDSWNVVKAYYEKQPPVEYHYQILQYFLVNEDLKTLHFAIYSDLMAATPALELQVFEIKREEIKEEIETARKMQEATLAIVSQEIAKLTF